MAHLADYWYCRDCDSFISDEDATIIVPEIHYELEGRTVELLCQKVCPECGNCDLEEAEYCEECGELLVPGAQDDWLCDSCRNRQQKKA